MYPNAFYSKAKEIYKLNDEQIDAIRSYNDAENLAYNLYLNVTGETMARNAEERNIKYDKQTGEYIEYDPEERKSLTISSTEDKYAQKKIGISIREYSILQDEQRKFKGLLNSRIHPSDVEGRNRVFGKMLNRSALPILQDRDELDAKHRDLYERYKEGDQEAYEEAVELVKADAPSFNLHKKGEL